MGLRSESRPADKTVVRSAVSRAGGEGRGGEGPRIGPPRKLSRVNKLKLLAVGAAVAAGLAMLARRRQQRSAAEADLWAEATDYVTPTKRD